ncbi:MAG: DUF4292 domain-containing protein [Cytophagaceae bacterium]|jgi:hypothetical protein|nr:DUF4292 domain-containing protein [Cytophagaceae bacterium]
MNKKVSVFLFLLLSFWVGSCSKKTTTRSFPTPVKIKLNPAVLQIDFVYFNMRSKVDFTDENGLIQFNLNTRCRQDSVVWASINKVGVEGLRVLVRPDSVFVIDKLKNILSVYNIGHLQSMAGTSMGYQQVQALMLGNLFFTKDSIDEWSMSNDTTHYILSQHKKNVHALTYVRVDNKKVDQVVLMDSISQNKMEVTYKNFQYSDSVLVAQEIIIDLTDAQLKKRSVVLSHQKIEFPKKGLNFPFNVPKKHEEK